MQGKCEDRGNSTEEELPGGSEEEDGPTKDCQHAQPDASYHKEPPTA